MSMDLEKQTFSTEPKYFIAGTNVPVTTAVKIAGADLLAHAPVLIATDDTVTPVADKANLTGLYGIATEATEKDKEAVIYLTGEFFADGLTLPDGITAGDMDVPLRNIGIFLK